MPQQAEVEASREDEGSNWPRVLAAVAVMVAIAAGVFAVHRVRYADARSAQAAAFASTFIRSSPIVEAKLGKVEQVKEVKEHHQSGPHPGWDLDYDVAGHHASGVVEMRLTTNSNYDVWNVPVAQLDFGHQSVALR